MQSIQDALELLQDKFSSWLEGFILLLPNFILAVITLAVAHFLAINTQNIVRNLLNRIVDNKALVNFLSTMTRLTVLLFGALVAVKILKLDQVIFSVLAGVGILGIVIGFAFQDIAANFIAGITLVFRKDYPFRVGDIVEANDFMGIVEGINLRDTMIRTFQGQSIFIPNKLIYENSVKNYSLLGKRRVDLGVGISYGDDLEKVEKITREAVGKVPGILTNKEIEIFFEEFGSSSINFQVRFWIPFNKQIDYLKARSQAIMEIKKHFDNNDITIPFPIRTLDFGIKGGMKLSEMYSVPEKNNSEE